MLWVQPRNLAWHRLVLIIYRTYRAVVPWRIPHRTLRTVKTFVVGCITCNTCCTMRFLNLSIVFHISRDWQACSRDNSLSRAFCQRFAICDGKGPGLVTARWKIRARAPYNSHELCNSHAPCKSHAPYNSRALLQLAPYIYVFLCSTGRLSSVESVRVKGTPAGINSLCF